MKLFDNDKSVDLSEARQGSFEDMLKAKSHQLPKIQSDLERIFKNYTGEMVAVIIIHEDENGVPESNTSLIAGVGRAESQIALMRAMESQQNQLTRTIVKSLADDPDMLVDMLKRIKKEK